MIPILVLKFKPGIFECYFCFPNKTFPFFFINLYWCFSLKGYKLDKRNILYNFWCINLTGSFLTHHYCYHIKKHPRSIKVKYRNWFLKLRCLSKRIPKNLGSLHIDIGLTPITESFCCDASKSDEYLNSTQPFLI